MSRRFMIEIYFASADVKVCDAFYSHCPFSYNFSFARAYNSRVREKLKGMVQ